MAQPKEKIPSDIKTRIPQKKTPSGIFDNLRSLPHPIMHKRLDLVGMCDPYPLTQVGP